MSSKWKKIKLLLSKRFCMIAPLDPAESESDTVLHNHINFQVSRSLSQPIPKSMRRGASFKHQHSGSIVIIDNSFEKCVRSAPTTPPPSFSGQSSVSPAGGAPLSRSACSICLEPMNPGQALFTAECSHVFHFTCIASSVRQGNWICPICRAKWKDVPWQAGMEMLKFQRTNGPHPRTPSGGAGSYGDAEQQRLRNLSFQFTGDSVLDGFLSSGEPNFYNDDEPLNQGVSPDASRGSFGAMHDLKVRVEVLAEVLAVPAHDSRQQFTVLVHLKAPPAQKNPEADVSSSAVNTRAPLDLVAVLDVSGSMAGRKLALLKQAMSFVVRNLSANDRLSVVVFSSTAKRIFPLRRMGEDGQRQALQAIDALLATGGTNIAEGLRKGAKVLEDCRERNPVCSIMLLSDGQDTHNMSSRWQLPFLLTRGASDSRRLVPRSIRRTASNGRTPIPVHTFGFGSDHDAATMHTISEVSGGTFSYIQAEEVVQDAFAQCIGGLLSVVAQDVNLIISCTAPGVLIDLVDAGSYNSSILDSARRGIINLGDLYAEEERDFLVDLKLPESQVTGSMSLVQVACTYKDLVTQETIQTVANELSIDRPLDLEEGQVLGSLEVDRQRNRLRTAEAIVEARVLADQGNIDTAQVCLHNARVRLGNSPSAQAGDQLCVLLDAELYEIQERMANRQVYERSGRAYLLSAHSCHLRQRATTRGYSVDGLVHDYQTQSMVDMITLSQTRPG